MYLSKKKLDYIQMTLLVAAFFFFSFSFSLAVATELNPTTESSKASSSEDSTTRSSGTETSILDISSEQREIISETFLDEEAWYNETEGVFTWLLPNDVTAVAVEITDNPENKPEENKKAVFVPPVEEFVVSKNVVKDGVQYVSVNFKNLAGWGEVTNRKLQIDTIAPEPFAINVNSTSKNSFPFITFEAVDQTSGLSYYEITVADSEPIRITPDEAGTGYQINDLEDGIYTVKVVATDKAGNVRESSTTVPITAGWKGPNEIVDEGTFLDFLTAINIFIFFLLMIIILQIIYFWLEHKQIKEHEKKLRRETLEIQDQMEKIFSALRDEIYDQINLITKRKKLSAREKEAVEKLTQALEVSETLIEKEVNDVKALLK